MLHPHNYSCNQLHPKIRCLDKLEKLGRLANRNFPISLGYWYGTMCYTWPCQGQPNQFGSFQSKTSLECYKKASLVVIVSQDTLLERNTPNKRASQESAWSKQIYVNINHFDQFNHLNSSHQSPITIMLQQDRMKARTTIKPNK